jgi:hypothetical protein
MEEPVVPLTSSGRTWPGSRLTQCSETYAPRFVRSVRYSGDNRQSSSCNIGTGLIGWTCQVLVGRNQSTLRLQLPYTTDLALGDGT